MFSEHIMEVLWAISYLADQLVELVVFTETHVYKLPEKVRRLISHFGFVRFGATDSFAAGFDFTDNIYAIVWRLLLEEVPAEFRVQNIWNPNSCGNMVESLMAIAFFGPSKLETVRGYLSTEKWARPRVVEAAARFLEVAVESGAQRMVADKIGLLEQMILLVHNLCRMDKTTRGIFSRLDNAGMNRSTLDEYVANFEAMRLGWGSAPYAQPGLQHTAWRCEDGGYSRWVIRDHPRLTQEQKMHFMRAAVFVACSREPAARFFAVGDARV